MRQGQQNNKRMRGRNRGKGPNPLTRSYESNGGDVKIRGTALHVAEKYVQLARDAQASGDRVASENYLQHAEHYYRIVAAAQAQMPQAPQMQPTFRNEGDGDDDELSDDRGNYGGSYAPNVYGSQRPPMQGNPQGGGQPSSYEPQPYANGGGNGADEARPDDQQGEQRFEPRGEGYDNRDRGGQGGGYGNQGGGGNFRHRRRRPFRDHYGDRGGGERPAAAAPERDPAAPAGEPQGDE
jgi:hypothetical protein